METSFGRLSRVLNCLQRTGRERRVAKVKYTPGRSSEIVHGFFLFLFLSFSFPPPPSRPEAGKFFSDFTVTTRRSHIARIGRKK